MNARPAIHALRLALVAEAIAAVGIFVVIAAIVLKIIP